MSEEALSSFTTRKLDYWKGFRGQLLFLCFGLDPSRHCVSNGGRFRTRAVVSRAGLRVEPIRKRGPQQERLLRQAQRLWSVRTP
ncbi:hypothetical protein RRG08_015285 [Elysia crispata]|uniref:Uncharacterized protein n=1 Tax=Elysia crispata TaxID=231223 RepID=A0AAE1DN11_9GAST|nr:hypothetical protein RRG08_015285 [Elysia crispata]